MIKTVYFDLGNVLVFFCHKKMIQQIAAVSGLSVQETRSILIEKKIQEDYELGKITTEQLYSHFAKLGNRSFSLLEFMEAASDIFTPNEEIFPVIRQLKDRKIRLILLSNTSECHFNRIYSHYPILRLFDRLVLSFEEGTCKPDPVIFQKALALAECSPSECFFTDDIQEFVGAARKSGLDSEVFSNVPILKKHLSDRKVFLD